MFAAIGIAEPQSAESAFDEDNAAQDVGSTSKARFGPRDLREGKTSLTQYPKILHAEYPLGEAFDIGGRGTIGETMCLNLWLPVTWHHR